MNRAKYLFVIFIGSLVYVCLSMTLGQNSIRCYRQMEEQKRIVSKRKSDIQNLNTELSLELTALKNDNAVISAYARKLDYVKEDEKIIKINGLKPLQTVMYDTGTIVRHTDPSFVSEGLCKAAGIVAGLFVLLLMVVFDIRHERLFAGRKREEYIAGIPVYDLPQV
ncbi:MAG: septum formation initiator family protein [Treponema sp.]|nr:septum formation initiator family protein [Treponema sp.]